jgi:WD40 repeat protein
VAYSPDGKVLASSSGDGTVRLWDVAGCKTTRTLKGHRGHVLCVAFSHDGKRLASGSGSYHRGGPETGELRCWEVPTGKSIVLRGHPSPVHSVAFRRDGKVLACGCGDGTVRLWAVPGK